MCKKWRIIGRNRKQGFLSKVGAGVFPVLAALVLTLTPFSASAATITQFSDVDPNAWYYGELSGAISAGLFNGVSATLFNVDKPITRAEFVAALARLCGVDTAAYSGNPFLDVSQEIWYYHYVSWAYYTGVVQGVSESAFAPEVPITREEMCKMLGGVIEKVQGKTLSADGALTFGDSASISPWAVEWVNKCSANGMINGSGGNFLPADHASRVQAACVIYRYYIRENPPVAPSLDVSGFSMNFDVNQDYYLCVPADFSNCRINGFSGFRSVTVSVEQYAGYTPYSGTPYVLGQPLALGYGRAKVTINATLQDGSARSYLIALADSNSGGYSYAKINSSGAVNFRAGPSTSSAILNTFINNARVYYLGTEGDWCRVQQLYSGQVGYVSKDYVKVQYSAVSCPARYQYAVAALQAAHPNWSFTFVDTGMDYQTYLNTVAANAYVTASPAEINGYLDPLNSLTEDKVFAFLNIKNYNAAYQSAGIAALWLNEAQVSKNTAAQYFTAAGNSLLLSPYYIATRAALESGYGTSTLSKGTVSGYEGYYNFFGIGAADSNPIIGGASYAKNRNWNSPLKAIVEGGNWIKDQYIDQGTITPYFFRYAALNGKSYMTDIAAPSKDADIVRRAYVGSGTLDSALNFVIPVYQNMP